ASRSLTVIGIVTLLGVDQPATGPAVHDAVGPQRAGRDQPTHHARHLLGPEPEEARQHSFVAEDRAARVALDQPLQRALAGEPPPLGDRPGSHASTRSQRYENVGSYRSSVFTTQSPCWSSAIARSNSRVFEGPSMNGFARSPRVYCGCSRASASIRRRAVCDIRPAAYSSR